MIGKRWESISCDLEGLDNKTNLWVAFVFGGSGLGTGGLRSCHQSFGLGLISIAQ